MLTEDQFKARALGCHIKDCDGMHIPNVPLMRKIVEKVQNDPTSWEQGGWVTVKLPGYKAPSFSEKTGIVRRDSAMLHECKTAYCVAGHAVMMSEDPFALVPAVSPLFLDAGVETVPSNKTERGYDARERAMHELGLTWLEAGRMFAGCNSWSDVKRAMNAVAALVDDRL